jgi:hypothetical protein
MRQRLVKILKPLHAISVENACGSGTPDINFSGGWLECKQLPRWPKKPSTTVKIHHFTPQQRLFLKNRIKAGGFADVCLKVGRDWFLINGKDAANFLGKTATREDIENLSYFWNKGKLNEKQLLNTLEMYL